MDSARCSPRSQETAPASADIASSGSKAVTTPKIFALPRKIRDGIYDMVLRVPHPLYLFQETDTSVETFAPDKPARWHALLYASRQVNIEASAVLYSRNKFSLLETTPKEATLLRNFLGGIGLVNAGSLSYLCVSFPFLEGQLEHWQLREDSVEILALLREKCTSLKTLEFVVHSKNGSWLTTVTTNTSNHTPEALAYIDRQLKAITTIEQILVKVSSGSLTPLACTTMRDLGWLTLTGHSN